MSWISSWWQKLIDWIKGKVTPTPEPKPKPTPTSCGCDLTLPTVWPLAQHGDKDTVDRWLGAGGAPECGGSGPRDTRALLVRPDGSFWGYAPFWGSGALAYNADASQVMFKCVDFEGQRYHFTGHSTQENVGQQVKALPLTWMAYAGGEHGMMTFWECRNLKQTG